MGFTGYKDFDSGSGNLIADYLKEWKDKTFGKNATATKFTPGGGSGGSSGVSRKDLGYSDNNVPSISSSGQLHLFAPVIGWSATPNYEFTPSAYTSDPAPFYTSASFTGSCFRKSYTGSRRPYIVIGFTAPVSGTYTIKAGSCAGSYTYLSGNSHSWETSYGKVNQDYSFAAAAGKKYYIDIYVGGYDACDFECVGTGLDVYCTPLTTTVKQQNNITINNNTWNGNIYQDNSTNLTYIYPQYTTINENNETVTNISNNPIIYNNTTNQYYTYDNTTNNYYYITYNTTPSPTPDPRPTFTPGGGASRGGGVGRTPADISDWVLSYYVLNNRRYDAYYALKQTAVDTDKKLPWVDNKHYISTTQIPIANGQYEVTVPDGVYWRAWRWDETSQTLTGLNNGDWHSSTMQFTFTYSEDLIFEFRKADGSEFTSPKDVVLKLKNTKITEYEDGGTEYEEPTPSPSPSPSPSPDPGTDPTPTPGGGGGGSGGGGGDGGGGSSWNPLKWLTDLLKDIVEGILKAILKLICTIFGFILWLLSLLAKLLPFLPSEAAAALVAGAVIVTVIRIIKFIIGR